MVNIYKRNGRPVSAENSEKGLSLKAVVVQGLPRALLAGNTIYYTTQAMSRQLQQPSLAID